MKRAKCTPGPWLVARTRDLFPTSKSAGKTIYKDRGTTEFKDMKVHNKTIICHIPDNPRAQFGANTDLLAAAPDLLEALDAVSAEVLRKGSTFSPAVQKLVADALNTARPPGRTK